MPEIIFERWHPKLIVAEHDGQRLARTPHTDIELIRGLSRTILVRRDFLNSSLNANFGPVLTDHFDHLTGHTLGGVLHVDHELIAVRQFADSITVRIGHADLIQQ